ncbi:MAG TPA: toxin-antitoxin system HicB family antitoxin [Jiangellaceae bacterium]
MGDIIACVKQMLLRVPDDLHGRLARAARERGTSVNALANQILNDVIPAAEDNRLTALREKARNLGVLVDRPRVSIPPERRAAAIASTRGAGSVLDELLADGR